MFSSIVVVMSSDPIVDAAQDAIALLVKAQEYAEAGQLDRVEEMIGTTIRTLQQGLPSQRTQWKRPEIDDFGEVI